MQINVLGEAIVPNRFHLRVRLHSLTDEDVVNRVFSEEHLQIRVSAKDSKAADRNSSDFGTFIDKADGPILWAMKPQLRKDADSSYVCTANQHRLRLTFLQDSAANIGEI